MLKKILNLFRIQSDHFDKTVNYLPSVNYDFVYSIRYIIFFKSFQQKSYTEKESFVNFVVVLYFLPKIFHVHFYLIFFLVLSDFDLLFTSSSTSAHFACLILSVYVFRCVCVCVCVHINFHMGIAFHLMFIFKS